MSEHVDVNKLQYINELISIDGEVTLGRYGPVDGATAASGSECLAMLVREPKESLSEILVRLDNAIRLAVEDDVFTDEVNSP